jgi:hypothetical protein
MLTKKSASNHQPQFHSQCVFKASRNPGRQSSPPNGCPSLPETRSEKGVQTLHGSLRTSSGQGTHGTDHEVLEDQVAALAGLASVVAEVWDSAGTALEWALEGGVGCRSAHRGADGAGGVGTGKSPRENARGGHE